MQAAREEARHALQWPGDSDDFLTEVVKDMDAERAQGTTTLSIQTVVLLDSVEHVLAHDVANFILVVAFETNKGCAEKEVVRGLSLLIRPCKIFTEADDVNPIIHWM